MVVIAALLLQLYNWKSDGRPLEQLLPVYKWESGCLLSKNGDITVVLELELPEIFTLSGEDYENVHHTWIRALKVLPPSTVVHKQDWFTQANYTGDTTGKKASFLSKAANEYFKGRHYLDHQCYVMITHKAVNRKPASSVVSNLLRTSFVPPDTINPAFVQEFLNKIGQFEKLLGDSKYIQVSRLPVEKLLGTRKEAGLLERYCFLLPEGHAPTIKDIVFKPEWQIGENHCQLYALSDVEDLPALCGSRNTYDKYSTDQTKFSIGFSAPLGLLLDCDHIYNQVIVLEDAPKVMKKMEAKRKRLQSLAAYSRENAINKEATNAFLNEAISQQRQPVKAHFNILFWTPDAQKIKDLRNHTSSAIAQMNGIPRQEIKGAAQLYWAGIPGNAADIPLNDTFYTFMEQATCFFNHETNYRSTTPDKGIRFCDRLTGRPVYVDLFDFPRQAGWTSNMGTLICGSSGGGKSMLTNAILRALYDQGAHCVTVDIGGSYKGLCELVGGYYFTYTEADPIKFNPFYLSDGVVLDTEKKEGLKSLLVALWKQENESFNRSEYVALSNALQGYYQTLEKDSSIFPCFNTFYEYLETTFVQVLKEQNLKEKDFDISNFLYVLRPYYKGGEFDYLLNATGNLDLLDQSFIVVEIDNIKDNVILFPVVCLILIELFISKMRKLAGVRKVLVIDEAWKAIAKSGMAEFLKYAFKTIRKFNGIPIVITQELDDLVSSPIIKDAIINNADVKILMDMKKFMNKFDRLQDTLGMSDKGKTQVLSVNKENREIYLDLGGHVMKVLKNELCPEEYWAFTTEGKERVKVQEYAAKYGSMEKGIAAIVAEMKKAI